MALAHNSRFNLLAHFVDPSVRHAKYLSRQPVPDENNEELRVVQKWIVNEAPADAELIFKQREK